MATLIGDLVHSRRSADRAGLHARLSKALDAVNRAGGPLTPLRITVGDEYQGTFASLPDAVRAAWRLRVRMLPECDLRQGLGWGEVRVLQEEPRVEDGPGWWVARDAVHAVELAEERSGTAWRRTAYRRVEGAAGPDPIWVESALVLSRPDGGRPVAALVVRPRWSAGGTHPSEIAAELGHQSVGGLAAGAGRRAGRPGGRRRAAGRCRMSWIAVLLIGIAVADLAHTIRPAPVIDECVGRRRSPCGSGCSPASPTSPTSSPCS